MDRQRREDDVDPAAVRQAAIDHRTGFVDAPSDSPGNLLRHRCDVIIVAETNRDPLQLALSLDIDIAWSVDHDVVDRFVQQERTERAVAGHVVRKLVRQLKLLATGQFEPFLVGDRMDDFLDLPPKNLARNSCGHGWLNLLHDPFAQRSRHHGFLDGSFACEADIPGCPAGGSLRPGVDAPGVNAGKRVGAPSRSALPNVFIARAAS